MSSAPRRSTRDRPTTGSPLDVLWQPPAIIWMMVAGEGLALVVALASDGDGGRWRMFSIASLGIQWVLLFSLVMLYALRRLLARQPPLKVAYAALALLLFNTWLAIGVAWFIWLGVLPVHQDSLLALQARATGIVLTVGMLGVAAVQNHWRARQLALRAKQAELEALQARIRPHFLFNTLNTGAALVHQRPEEAERLLMDLADLFRAALAGPREISLGDELALARRYLEIEELRFRERLQVRWQLPREMPEVKVPALSIQPLVENAIRHGVERMPGGGDLEIAVTTTQDTVVVRISNPLPRTAVHAQPGHRVGLNASQARIGALTGGLGSVQTNIEGERFIATVRLPIAAPSS